MVRTILISAGTISLFIGILGIFIPGLPTTPFLILTAGLYLRSSPALHSKLINHRLTALWLREQPVKARIITRVTAVLIMWTSIILASVYAISSAEIIALLIMTGAAGTYFKLRFLFTRKKENSQT